MDAVFVLLAGIVLSIPVMAIVALVRTGKLRDVLEESNTEHGRELEFLRKQVDALQRQLKQLSEREATPALTPAPAPRTVVAAAEPKSPVVTVPPEPKPAPADTPFIAVSASIGPAPTQVPVKQSAKTPEQPVASLPSPADRPQPSPSSPPVPAFGASYQAAPPPQAPPSAPTASRRTEPAAAAFMPAAPPRKSLRERLGATLPLEEVLGMNVFAKIGIVLLVLGFALLGRMALISMGPGERVGLIYTASAAILGGGIWLETKERYRILGRAGIGGGWALLFFTTYALNHVSAMAVLDSNTVDCVLMLLVAVSMVAHTLRYKSQVVTGLAFLLAFSTVALSQDSIYALSAGVILALGIVAIGLRMQWYELEVFGIVASYANHFYWLYKLYPDGFSGRPFPQFWPSVIILLLYWLVFRVSYVFRRVASPRQESVSTAAAMINTIALLGVMKFQSTRPELAFYALLALGAAEFFFGQIPHSRRRRMAFKLLTVMGTILIFASVPFKFSGNSIALFWMIAAELLLAAGVLQPEIVFQRLGSIAGTLTGCLILFEARHIVEFRTQSESPVIRDGILLLMVSLLFCINAHFVRRKWSEFFAGIDAALAAVQGYLGAATAFFAVWALFPSDWTAPGWAALFLVACAGKRYLDDKHLLAQAFAFAGIVLFRCEDWNCHFGVDYPHHLAARLVTLPLLAAAFYLAGWILSGIQDARIFLRVLALWAGSFLLSELIWCEVSQPWVALVWVAFAVALVLIARRLNLAEFTYQQHVLAVAAVAQLTAVNLNATTSVARYVPFLGCAAAFYAISRFSTLKDAPHRRFAGWAHTSIATALVAALAWHESPQPWLAAIWAGFALALALTDRIFSLEELPWQAHVLSLLAVLRVVTLNLYLNDIWHGMPLRLITVAIVIVSLYCIARWVRLPQALSDADARHIYTWAASGLVAWLMWAELRPVALAVAWAVFGLILFEIAAWKHQVHLRWQAFIALGGSFARIFFVNLTAEALPGERLSPRLYTIVPLALIYFYVWSRLRPSKTAPDSERWNPTDLIAHFGTASIAALLYFEMDPVWIIVAWAALVLVLVAAALVLSRRVFLQQAHLLVAGIVIRGLVHNIFGGSYFVSGEWRGSFSILSITAVLLLAALPLAFRLRSRYHDQPISKLDRLLATRYPEQVFFFAPVLLVTLTIAVKMNSGMVTLSCGIEGVLVILLGLLVSQRSYRLTGLLLLLLCVAKIVVRDAWLLGDRDRYTTFIVLGAALTLVSLLYGRYREAVRRLL
jgi:uncharacterized membrane protein